MSITEQITSAILDFQDPYAKVTWRQMGVNVTVTPESNSYHIAIKLPYPAVGAHDVIARSLREHILAVGVALPDSATIHLTHQIVKKRLPNANLLPNIKHVIAVGSGKGGVGKSTTAVNLAFALQLDGARVGILDADIYGPSIPTLLGRKDAQPVSPDGKRIEPVMAHGLASMSLGYLVDEGDAVIWRGPMASGALQQLLNDTLWPELDYLVLDLPPGTGDVQLTMAQRIPVSGALVVTTPQDLAMIDARKAIRMFTKVNVPVLGVCENMAVYVCPSCGHRDHIFGDGGADLLAKEHDVPVVGRLPLNGKIRACSDSGRSMLLEAPESDLSQPFREMARHLAARLAATGERAIPEIKIVED